jgi:hypothetical protein
MEEPSLAKERDRPSVRVSREGRYAQPVVSPRMAILGFCLVVIAAVLVLPQVDLLDAAGAEVTSIVVLKCHLGVRPSAQSRDLQTPMRQPDLKTALVSEHPAPVLLPEERSSQDFLCLLRC